jgi:hypothetical protein
LAELIGGFGWCAISFVFILLRRFPFFGDLTDLKADFSAALPNDSWLGKKWMAAYLVGKWMAAHYGMTTRVVGAAG